MYHPDNNINIGLRLWFDVGTIRDTTIGFMSKTILQLWFDVGTIRDTTLTLHLFNFQQLWFDVGTIRDTTPSALPSAR